MLVFADGRQLVLGTGRGETQRS
ncbi:hypothetical protein E2C01_091246 [Portunus trituberculatus]|uniref:Uncharacterized protein n=1 Tax=Portunus trituberculatus TaxID=210409 RepID=A0A5B7JNI5_PORTR|nr:hypothetical protein [Portunus trituberculatus]